MISAGCPLLFIWVPMAWRPLILRDRNQKITTLNLCPELQFAATFWGCWLQVSSHLGCKSHHESITNATLTNVGIVENYDPTRHTLSSPSILVTSQSLSRTTYLRKYHDAHRQPALLATVSPSTAIIPRLHSWFHAEYVCEKMRLDSPPGAHKRTCAKCQIVRRSTSIKTSTMDDADISHYRKNAYKRWTSVELFEGCVKNGDTNCALHLMCMVVRLLMRRAHLRRETHPQATCSVFYEHHRELVRETHIHVIQSFRCDGEGWRGNMHRYIILWEWWAMTA